MKRLISCLMTLVVLVFGLQMIPNFTRHLENLALISAGLFLPEGGLDYCRGNITYRSVEPNATHPTSDEEELHIANPDTLANTASQNTASVTPPNLPDSEKGGNIITKEYGGGTKGFVNFENVWVKNEAKTYTADIEKILQQAPDLTVKKDDKPYVLIYHTHTTESFMDADYGYYAKDFSARTRDSSQNIIRVGDEIVAALEKAGIGVIHDKNIYDDPSYNGAYYRSQETVEKYKAQYPSLTVLLDVHRDAIQQDDGTKIKPTVLVNGKKAAQIMIITGIQEDPVTDFPDWQYNLRFALQLQKTAANAYPGLMRPILFAPRVYNMNESRNSVLLEMGSDSNTLEEAIYSGQLMGNVLVKMLNKYAT